MGFLILPSKTHWSNSNKTWDLASLVIRILKIYGNVLLQSEKNTRDVKYVNSALHDRNPWIMPLFNCFIYNISPCYKPVLHTLKFIVISIDPAIRLQLFKKSRKETDVEYWKKLELMWKFSQYQYWVILWYRVWPNKGMFRGVIMYLMRRFWDGNRYLWLPCAVYVKYEVKSGRFVIVTGRTDFPKNHEIKKNDSGVQNVWYCQSWLHIAIADVLYFEKYFASKKAVCQIHTALIDI